MLSGAKANSVSGKRTFIEYGVCASGCVSRKITSDLLPYYGRDWWASLPTFASPINSLNWRNRHLRADAHGRRGASNYQSKPIGDDRGNLLVAEVGKG